jgi:DNA-binding NarL/FixJ family response regulator
MGTDSIIATAISNLDEEIERLTEAREDLMALLEEQTIEEKKETPRVRRAKQAIRSTKKVTPKATRKATGNGSDAGKNRREQIMDLLDEGWSVRDIADELEIKPNYVYHVKADWNELAAA